MPERDFADELFGSGLAAQAAHDYAPHAEARFTGTGGFVMLQKAANGYPRMLAVASGEWDEGVELDDEDCLLLAEWLVTQVRADSGTMRQHPRATAAADLARYAIRDMLAVLVGPDPR